MLRTIFGIGLFALAGLFLLKLLFGIVFLGLGLFGLLFGLALKVLLIGGGLYLVVRVFSPDTARRLRDKFSSPRY